MFNSKYFVKLFYIQQYKLLRCFAVWDLSDQTSWRFKFAYQLCFWHFLIFWMVLFDLSMIIQLIKNISNVDEIIKVLFMFGTALAVRGKFYYMKLRKDKFEQYFSAIYQKEFLPRNSEEQQIFLEAFYLSRKIRNSYGSLSVLALSGLLMSWLVTQEREFIISMYFPMELNTDFKYGLAYVYQCLGIACLCFINVAFDSLTSSCFIHLKSQLDMLAYRLESIGRVKGGCLSQDGILQQLKNCVNYYQQIWELSHLVEDLVCIPMSIQIGCSVFVLIANFYAMSLMSSAEDMGSFLKYLIYQSCMLSQIFIVCYFANEFSLKSSELSLNLYNSDWYEWNRINRRLAMLMMLRFEAPLRIKTLNSCYSFNLAAFTSIVNSSYSYFALLKRVNS